MRRRNARRSKSGGTARNQPAGLAAGFAVPDELAPDELAPDELAPDELAPEVLAGVDADLSALLLDEPESDELLDEPESDELLDEPVSDPVPVDAVDDFDLPPRESVL